MGSLKSVKDVPGIDYYDYRDSLYWGKFKYRVRVKIKGLAQTYWVNNIQAWINIIKTAKYLNENARAEALSPVNVSRVENFMAFKSKLKSTKTKDITIRIEGNTAAIFSNDLSMLQDFRNWNAVVDYTEAIPCEFAGIKYFLRPPKHKYRIHFINKRIELGVSVELRDLLEKYPKITPSGAFKLWLQSPQPWKLSYISANFYIDFDDESMASYLRLCHSDIFGKMYKLELRPDAP